MFDALEVIAKIVSQNLLVEKKGKIIIGNGVLL